jgi:hypothetical protein
MRVWKLKNLIILIVIMTLGSVIYMSLNYQSASDTVEAIFTGLASGEHLYGLTDEQAADIMNFLQEPAGYQLPHIELNLRRSHTLDIHLTQHTLIQVFEREPHLSQVFVSFQILEYNPGKARMNHFVLERTYQGSLVFLLENTGWGKWTVVDVKTLDFRIETNES